MNGKFAPKDLEPARRMVGDAFTEYPTAQGMVDAAYPLETTSERDRAAVTESLRELAFWLRDALAELDRRHPRP